MGGSSLIRKKSLVQVQVGPLLPDRWRPESDLVALGDRVWIRSAQDSSSNLGLSSASASNAVVVSCRWAGKSDDARPRKDAAFWSRCSGSMYLAGWGLILAAGQ